MPRDDLIEVEGVVVSAMGGGQYKVGVTQGESTSTVRAQLSGKLKQHHIRVLPGDAVTVSVSPYDLSHGIITHRGRKIRES